jgi:hypothetical protein
MESYWNNFNVQAAWKSKPLDFSVWNILNEVLQIGLKI